MEIVKLNSYSRCCIFNLVLLFVSLHVAGQSIVGKVYYPDKERVVGHAEITLTDSKDKVYTTQSDIKGNYSFHLNRNGTYLVQATYEDLVYSSSILIQEDVELVMDLVLDFKSMHLENVTINEHTYRFGDLTMTQNQYKVMPASFQDPSRIMIRYPGFSTANDGANSIVFRGLPPETTKWQLFGVDIVNPNHLSNAGTANDLATNYAGGVNAINGSVLDYFHFEANPADASYGDVLSGVANMKLAPAMKSYIDINLIGLEAGLGTSLGNKNFYASYRYSFTGLLNQFGIDFGNEKIGYQDISAYGDLIKTDRNHLKIFATLGKSHNYYNSIDTLIIPEKFKDIQNIDYTSSLGIAGLQFTHQKDDMVFQSTLAASSRTDERTEITNPFFVLTTGLNNTDEQSIKSEIISMHNQFRWSGEKLTYTVGLGTGYHADYMNTNTVHADKTYFNIYPYGQLQNNATRKWHYTIGSGLMYDDRTGSVTLEPAMTLNYRLNEQYKFKINYRRSSFQDYTNLRYIAKPFVSERIVSDNLQLGCQYDNKFLKIGLTGFLHLLHNVPSFSVPGVEVSDASIFNGSNLGYDQLRAPFIIPGGTSDARVYGGESYVQFVISGSNYRWVIDGNVSIFNAEYRLGESGQTYKTGRYNYGFTSNQSVSFEKDIIKENRRRKWIVSLAQHRRGGQHEPVIHFGVGDPDALYDYSRGFVFQEPGYSRFDFRVVYSRKMTASNLRHIWSLDIQNLFNYENFGYRYYDFLLKDVIYQKQLGLVPVLSYRLIWE
ncbi:MAG TPA: carboxypeptidase-like regulatory domain-containing protein [Saprospiraceae bacterium]|nr:carboxypeptidase-like regulatory domain-containing protein [Saprospiraceae bacterium]HRP40995.1 carboxypeptidase-like regulatory domain-containing protein [Saprospiraceae bacterium]